MWHTSRGDRTLRGAEAALVGSAIDTMVDGLLVHVDVDFDDESAAECESGIAIYDRLTASQRIGLLHDVATHLLTDTPTPMPLSATAEATVAAIFVEVRDQVAIEIDLFPEAENDQPSWRQMVLDAYDQFAPGGTPETESQDESGGDRCRPSAVCTDMRLWEELIDTLASAILWDRDFEMADSFLDVDPGISHQRRRLLGISEDYFTSVAPDPRPEEVFQVVSRTRDIVRVKPR